ncbi:MAG TPA: RcnB family protein, partial [Ramlibacter sp.]
GLAKKHNGCMPPGQARKYYVGQPLPAQVVYYPVPQPVLVQLPPPPPQHKYVRVAGDILLIAVGTSMVVDAISDIQR